MSTKYQKSVVPFALLLALLFASFAPLAVYAQSEEETQQALTQLVASSETFTDWLAEYPNWKSNVYPSDTEGVWVVEFYTEAEDDWLGYASINAETGEIYEAFAPKPLPPEVYQEQQAKVQKLTLDDPEVLAYLGDPILWDFYMDYNRYESVWDLYFYRGVEAVLVKAAIDENNYFSINSIVDPNELTEEQALDDARNQAISLAYSAEGVDAALEGHDDWRTYVEPQGGSRWSVSFAANDQELFYALVDIEVNVVLASQAGGQ
ncbi:MAG: hypothetical protein K8L97_24205 [Anaerolineae bacterium]|nr:hypothetical protein [Anaerolineae bacterium]